MPESRQLDPDDARLARLVAVRLKFLLELREINAKLQAVVDAMEQETTPPPKDPAQ